MLVKVVLSIGNMHYVHHSNFEFSLKKSKAAGVSSTPGFTKNMQEIYLDSKVKLLDCPGVVFSTEDEKLLALRNIIKVWIEMLYKIN